MQRDRRMRRGERHQLRRRDRSEHRDAPARGRRQLRLPRDRLAAAGDDDAAAGKVEEDRQARERVEPRRPSLGGDDVARHGRASRVAPFRGPVFAWKSAPFAVFAT